VERGHIMPQGRAKLAAGLADLLDGNEPILGPRIHALRDTCDLDGRNRLSVRLSNVNKIAAKGHA
jgi:hypothetical protein